MAITINVNLDEILAALKNDLDFTGNADKYIKVNATADGFEFAAVTAPTWGAITGTLSSQTDLQTALDAKANLSGAAFTGDVSVTTSGSGDTLQLTNSGSGTTLNIVNSGSGDFLTIDSTKLVIDNGGDVSIGTATASARFHVLTGSTSKVGAIIQAAAGQTANLLEINSSSGSGGDLFRVEDDGRIYANRITGIPTGGNTFEIAANTFTRINAGNSYPICLSTSSNSSSIPLYNHVVFIQRGFAPSSGSGDFNYFSIIGTINQTGSATNIVRGVYVNNTLTSAVNYRAIETTGGNIVFGNLPTSSAGLPTGAIWNDSGTLKIA